MRRVISLPMVPAAAQSPCRPVESAGDRTELAPGTADDEAPAGSPQGTPDEIMLAALRPRTWGDCLRDGWGVDEPCPWVGCTHHLLLDVRESDKQGQGLRINGVRSRGAGGPKVHRPTTEDAATLMVDEAIAALWALGASCSLRFKGETAEIAKVMGVSDRLVRYELKRARAELKEHGVDLEVGE